MTDARARSLRACSSSMSISGRMPHSGPSIARQLCTSTRGSPLRTVSGCGSAGGRPGSKRAVDQQAPDLLERHDADEVLDVDAAIAQRAALLVGLGDLGGEGDDALEPGLDVGEVGSGGGVRASCDLSVAGVGSAGHVLQTPTAATDLCSAPSPSSPRSVRNGEITARELVQASLDRIDAVNPKLNAFIDVFGEEALAEADGDRRRRPAAVRRRPDRDQEQPRQSPASG